MGLGARLTKFNGYIGGKASNPAISTDGKHMRFNQPKLRIRQL
jgi:hypothetical protein